MPCSSAASATAWTLCFDTESAREIAFLGIPASSRRRISLALVLLAMWFLLFSRVHGEKNRSGCGAEWEYRRCRRAMLGTGANGAETQYRAC